MVIGYLKEVVMKKVLVLLVAFLFLGSPPAFSAPQGEYVLKDGEVFRDGVKIEDVHIIPAGDGEVRFWVSLGPDFTDGLVPEEETGVRFFGSEGPALAFLPRDSESETQELAVSPGGDYFVIGLGGARFDLNYEIYRYPSMEGMEVELAGIRGSLEWMDEFRFVLTKIDDIREEGRMGGLSYGLRLSAIIYEIPIEEEVVLNGSTDTKNFYVDGVDKEQRLISITEESVEKVEDWADEEKIKIREFTVEFPGVG